MKILNLADRQRQNEYRYEVAQGDPYTAPDKYINLFAYYKLDGNGVDSVGSHNINEATVSWLTSGQKTGTGCMDVFNDYAYIPLSTDFDITNGSSDIPFSFSFYLYLDSNGEAWYFSNRNNTSTNARFELYYYASDFTFNINDGAGNAIYVRSQSWSATTGVWKHIVCTYDGSESENGMNIYEDGVNITTVRIQAGTYTGVGVFTEDINIGNPKFSPDYNLDGRLDCLAFWDKELSQAEITAIYDIQNAGGDLQGYDYDAKLFIDKVELTDTLTEEQRLSVNDLVVGLKANGTWSKYKAIYPFIGGTASSHKWNLKDPFDLDVSFRLLFTDGGGTGWIHSSTGAKPDGTGAYADLGGFRVNPDTNENDVALGIYSKTDVAENSKFGVRLSGNSAMSIMLKDSSNNLKVGLYYDNGSDTLKKIIANAKATTGFWHFSKGGGQYGVFDVLHNGSVFDSGTMNTSSPSASKYSSLSAANSDFYLGALNFEGTAQDFSSREIAFFCISDYLTQTEVLNDSVLIQEYQEALGRAISIGTELNTNQDASAPKGDLETNTLTLSTTLGWEQTVAEQSLSSTDTDFKFGSYSVYMEALGTIVYSRFYFPQTINKKYRLNFWAKKTVGTFQEVRLYNTTLGTITILSGNLTSDWTRYVYDFEASTSGTSRVNFYSSFGGQIGDNIYIDNLSIIELD